MQFSREGPYHRVARITGPRHNLLDLEIVEGTEPIAPVLEELPQIGTCSHEPLDHQSVMRHVLGGVKAANAKLGTTYSVRSIRIVRNDTPPAEVYEMLAALLVEHAHRSSQVE